MEDEIIKAISIISNKGLRKDAKIMLINLSKLGELEVKYSKDKIIATTITEDDRLFLKVLKSNGELKFNELMKISISTKKLIDGMKNKIGNYDIATIERELDLIARKSIIILEKNSISLEKVIQQINIVKNEGNINLVITIENYIYDLLGI